MSKFLGMTVNERLYSFGLMDQFDSAIQRRDEDKAISILMETELNDQSAKETVEAIMKSPGKYGYNQN